MHVVLDIMDPERRASCEAIGVQIEDASTLVLPDGWSQQQYDGEDVLFDAQGNPRIELYDAGHNCASCIARLYTRYTVSSVEEGRKWAVVARDRKPPGRIVKSFGTTDSPAGSDHPHVQAARQFLAEQYPDWQNPAAYWDRA